MNKQTMMGVLLFVGVAQAGELKFPEELSDGQAQSSELKFPDELVSEPAPAVPAPEKPPVPEDEEVILPQKIWDLIYSAGACEAKADIAAAKKKIQRERRYAIGGVLSLKKIHDAQEDFKDADLRLRKMEKELKKLPKKRVFACSSKPVVNILRCVNESRDGRFNPDDPVCGNDSTDVIEAYFEFTKISDEE